MNFTLGIFDLFTYMIPGALVSATPEGRRVFERGRAARVRAIARLLDGLSERDIATLRRAADIIAGRL